MPPQPTTPDIARRVPRPQSPVTLEKKEDVEEMSELNSRLERYLVKVRDLGKQNEELKEKLDSIRKSKGLGSDDRDEKQLKAKLADLEKEKKELLDGIRDLDVKKETKKKAIDHLKDEIDKDTTKLAGLDYDILELNQQIGHLKDRPKNFDPRRLQEIQLLKEKIRDKEAEIEDLKKNEKDQLQQALDKEKGVWAIQEEDEIKDLRSFYESKLDGLNKREASVKKDRESHEAKKVKADGDVQSLKYRLRQLQSDRDRLLVEYDKIRENKLLQLELARRERAAEVRVLGNELGAKDREFKNIERANIEFKEEIKKYEDILKNEEKRMSLPSPPSKKRKRAEADHQEAVFVSSSSGAEQGSIVVREPDALVSFVRSKPGRIQISEITASSIRLSNLTSADVNYSGWHLQVNPSSSSEPLQFAFPDGGLVAEASIYLNSAVFNVPTKSFDLQQYGPGSSFVILDQNGHIVSSVEITEGLHKVGNFDRTCSLM